MNRIGTEQPDPDVFDEWQDNVQITDADAALSDLPNDLVSPIISAIGAVDPFWPTYCEFHRLTWR